MLAALAKQKVSREWTQGYVPHPTTWLSGRRWEDEIPAEQPAERPQAGAAPAWHQRVEALFARNGHAKDEQPEQEVPW
jgi:hypothetical protein